MPRNPLPMDQVYPRRLAARALTMALESLGLAAVAIRWNPDDPEELLPGGDPDEFVIGAPASEKPVARVYLEGSRARVIVEHLDDVLRPGHRKEFEPAEIGLHPRPGDPDLATEVDLTPVIETEGDLLRAAPQRLPARHARWTTPPRVIRALGSRR